MSKEESNNINEVKPQGQENGNTTEESAQKDAPSDLGETAPTVADSESKSDTNGIVSNAEAKKSRKSVALHRALVVILRAVVGGVFILSGFVKAIDLWGSVYKFSDYLHALNLEWLMGTVDIAAATVATVEFVLGVMLFTGCYRRLVPILLTAMMAIMTPLTLYLALTDAVSDCGCFGDAIVLTNWQTFSKNVLLSLALIYLIYKNGSVKNYYGVRVHWIVGIVSFFYIIQIEISGYAVQPLLDFRPFKIGTKLVSEEPQEEPTFTFIYSKNGQSREFAIDSLPDDTWEFVERREHHPAYKVDTLEERPHLTILDKDGEDITADVIRSQGDQLLLLMPELDDTEVAYTYTINELYDYANTHSIAFTALTSEAEPHILAIWKDLSMAQYKMYSIDDSILKQIARGNPALVYLSDGVIRWKRAMHSINDVEQFSDPTFDISAHYNNDQDSSHLRNITTLYVLILLWLLALNRSIELVRWMVKKLRRAVSRG